MLEHQFQDPHFWVLISTILFAILLYVKGRGPLLSMLDARTAKIRAELEEAERLKAEAQALLEDIRKKHSDAVQTAQKIVDNAKDTAARYQKESEEKLNASLKRREEQLLERIARAETSAIAELRTQAADIAASSAEILLNEAMGKRGAKLVDEAIGDIPAKLN